MTGQANPLGEAAAFFDLFLGSDWSSCHVRGADIEMFVARTAGHANPMLGLADDEHSTGAALDDATLSAPHVGTLVELAAIGSSIAAGERYGVIELLGETIELVSDRAGTIGRHIGRPGALVQYDEALVTLH